MTASTVNLSAIAFAAVAMLVLSIACGTDDGSESTLPIADSDGVAAAPADPDSESESDGVVDEGNLSAKTATGIGSTIVEAPVLSLEIEIRESGPPVYIARVVLVRPDSCHTFDHMQTSFDPLNGATDVYVAGYNEVISGENISCDDAISTSEVPVTIGVDFEEGVEYTVHAGDLTVTFFGQGSGNAHDILLSLQYSDGPAGVEDGIADRPLFGVEGRKIDFRGAGVNVYEYETIADSLKAVMEAQILSSWPEPPTIYRRGNTVVVLIGETDPTAMLLHELLQVPPVDSEESGTTIDLPSNDYVIELEYKEYDGTVTFLATIVGGPDSNQDMYCGSTLWDWGDGQSMGISASCIQWEEGATFPRSHEQGHVYAEAGLYKAVFRYGDLYSNTATVRVETGARTSRAFEPEEAAEQPDGSHIQVKGTLFIGADGIPGLCWVMLASLPPQCNPPVTIENLPQSFYEDLESASGIRWGSGLVTISGVITNGVLLADD